MEALISQGYVDACKGTNCTSTDGRNHSTECQAEYALAIAERRHTVTTTPAREIYDRDALALACMTDEQAFASWERFKEMRSRYVKAVLEGAQ